MAVAFLNIGAVASGTGALTVTPNAAGGDGVLSLLVVESANEAVATPSGWTLLTTPISTGTAATAGATRLTIFWMISSGGNGGTAVTVADSGNHTVAVIAKYTGFDPVTPFGAMVSKINSPAISGTIWDFAQCTVNGSMSFCAAALDLDSNASGAGLGAAPHTRRVCSTVNAGTGGGVHIVDLVVDISGTDIAYDSTGLTSISATLNVIINPYVPINYIGTASGACVATAAATLTNVGALSASASASATATASLTTNPALNIQQVAGPTAGTGVGISATYYVRSGYRAANDTLLAFGNSTAFVKSTSLGNWADKSVTNANNPNGGPSVAASPDRFVVLAYDSGSTGVFPFYSYDGEAWTQASVGSPIMPFGYTQTVVWGGNHFLAVGTNGTTCKAWRSIDGTSWSAMADRAVTGVFENAGYGNGQWVVIDSSNSAVLADGGTTWTSAALSSSSGVLTNSVQWSNPTYYKGSFYSLSQSVFGVRQLIKSTDGLAWTIVSTVGSVITANTATMVGPFVMNGALCIAIDNEGSATQARLVASTDGATWTTFSLSSILSGGGSFGIYKRSTDIVYQSGNNYYLVKPTVTNFSVTALDGSASATSSATATFFVPYTPNFVAPTLASVASTAAALTTGKPLLGTLKCRARPVGGGYTELPDIYSPFNTAYEPQTGIILSLKGVFLPSVGRWSTTPPKPDGTNAPGWVASNSAGKICALMSTGPQPYTTTNGTTWTAGTSLTAPPFGFANAVNLRLIGANGNFVFYAKNNLTANGYCLWASSNGTNWSQVTIPANSFTDYTLAIIPTDRGFVMVQAENINLRQNSIYTSPDGVTWTYRGVVGLISTIATEDYHSASGDYLCIHCSTTQYSFISLVRLFVAGEAAVHRTFDNSANPGYLFGDRYSIRPHFYIAGAANVGRIEDVPQAGSGGITIVGGFFPTASGITATGDFSVFDGTFYARAVRTADSVQIGAFANAGPLLRSPTVSLAGSAQALASASGSFSQQVPLAGTIAAVSAATASLTTRQPVAGTAQSVATATAALSIPQLFVASATAQATATGALTTSIRVAGACAATSTAAGALTTGVLLVGSAAATTSASATTITVPKPLAGAASALASATADLSAFRPLVASVQAQAQATAGLTTSIRVAGAAQALASASGDLLVGSLLVGSCQSQASAQASLTTAVQFVGTAACAATLASNLLTQISLDSAVTAQSIAEGDLTTSIELHALVQAVVSAVATIRRTVSVAARIDPLFAVTIDQPLVIASADRPAVHTQVPDSQTAQPLANMAVHTARPDSLTTTELDPDLPAIV